MKNIMMYCLAFIGLFAFSATAVAAENNPDVFVNEREAAFDEAPVIINGVTYIELRGICNAIDHRIGWNQQSKSASCSSGSIQFAFSQSDTHYTLNGNRKAFIHTPRLICGRTMISLREVGEVFRHNVQWINLTNEILLMRPDTDDAVKGRIAGSFLERLSHKKMFSGSALIAKQGNVLRSEGYGYADLNKKIKNTPDTEFAVASITKGFTGIGIMQLAEKGKLDFSDKVGKYIPDLPYGNRITIHQLLTHTAGLPWEQTENWENITLIYEPGKGQRYSNIGYQMLGEIIETVSGSSYQEYMNEHVFREISASDSGFDISTSSSPHKADGHTLQNGREIYVTRDFASRGGSGALFSSAEDLYKLDQALYSDVLMSRESVNNMLKRHETNWGYGWQVYHAVPSRVSQLTGSTTGFKSFIKRNERHQSVIILLGNNDIIDIDKIGQTIDRILH